MKLISVVGARPQFVKLAPIDRAARAANVQHIIVHTGQHYDPLLSDVFFRDLGISAPSTHLGVGSGTHGAQTGAMLGALEEVFDQQQPDWVLAYGDTNSTLAAAVSAVKLHLPLAHLEAGLRSFNRRMPEEHNRVLTDHAADLLLAPTEIAVSHLRNEGLADRTVLVGDVMTDVLLEVRQKVEGKTSTLLRDLQVSAGQYFLATIHRPDNTDDPERLRSITAALASLELPVVLLAHPRVVAKARQFDISLSEGSLIVHSPLPYPELVAAVTASAGVITDSGGLQKEAFLLRVPCTTLRAETEWVETVELGWNRLANSAEEIRTSVMRPAPEPTNQAPYGDGRTSERVISLLNSAPEVP